MSVEPFHLFRYLDEQAYRFNNRQGANDFDRFKTAAAQIVGRRLTWKQLVGKLQTRQHGRTETERKRQRRGRRNGR